GLSWFGFVYEADWHYRLRTSGLDHFLYDLTVYPFLLLIAYGVLTGIPDKRVRRSWFALGTVLLLFAIIGPPLLTYLMLAWFGAGAIASVAYALLTGSGNKLVLACWTAILPMAIVHFLYPITGWPMFGYRYALDFYPFLFLLTWVGMRNEIKWHHALLITASILVCGTGVFWDNIFEDREVFYEPGSGIRWINW
ncbi:MAG: hypothetical protein ACRD1T_16595, partial [Acidimicrobiia bacterium]